MIKLEDLREIFETAGTGAVDLLLVFFSKDSLYHSEHQGAQRRCKVATCPIGERFFGSLTNSMLTCHVSKRKRNEHEEDYSICCETAIFLFKSVPLNSHTKSVLKLKMELINTLVRTFLFFKEVRRRVPAENHNFWPGNHDCSSQDGETTCISIA